MRPGLVRQASGVIVDVGNGKGVKVAWGVCEAVGGRGVAVGAGWFNGEQAQSPARSVSSVVSSFVRRTASLVRRIASLIA